MYTPDIPKTRPPKSPDYFQTARKTQNNLNKPLPRIDDAPKDDTLEITRKFNKKYGNPYDTKVGNTPNTEKGNTFNDFSKNLNLPSRDERNFAMGAFGEEAERQSYNSGVMDEFKKSGYLRSTKTQDDYFREGFTGIEKPDVYEFTPKADDNVKRSFYGFLDVGKPHESRMEAFAKIRDENADRYAQDDASHPQKTSFDLKKPIEDAWANTKETAEKLWEDAKATGKNLINGASSWANEKGFFDDATNAFFKVADISQEFPIKILPTGLAHRKLADENYAENQKIDLSIYEETGGYINNQGSQAGKIRYGLGTFKENGCEIIAVNNALVSLGNRKDIRDIARDFETNGQTAFGYLGTSPFAIGEYFKKQGYQVETVTGDKKIHNLDIPDADAYIVSFWNSDAITGMIHTVAVDKLPNGKYRVYNTGGESADVESLNKYLLEKKRVPLVLHCIKKGR